MAVDLVNAEIHSWYKWLWGVQFWRRYPLPKFPWLRDHCRWGNRKSGRLRKALWSCVLRAWTYCNEGYLTRLQIQQVWDFEKGFSLVFQAGFQLECNTLQVSCLFWSLASVWKISDVKSITVTWVYIFYTWTVLLKWILCWISLYINSSSK